MNTNSESEKFDSWALVELFGHQRIVGRVTEATLAGGAFIRVDVPADAEKPAFTRYFGPSAIYGLSPLSEEIALHMIKSTRLEPVHEYQMPRLDVIKGDEGDGGEYWGNPEMDGEHEEGE
jgi:hypothetical protein